MASLIPPRKLTEIEEQVLLQLPPGSEKIAQLFRLFPTGSYFMNGSTNEKNWIVGFSVNGAMALSPINPLKDYEASIEKMFTICPNCVNKILTAYQAARQ